MEQVETAQEAKAARGPKATIRRQLTRVHTPATATGQHCYPGMQSNPVDPGPRTQMPEGEICCRQRVSGGCASDGIT